MKQLERDTLLRHRTGMTVRKKHQKEAFSRLNKDASWDTRTRKLLENNIGSSSRWDNLLKFKRGYIIS